MTAQPNLFEWVPPVIFGDRAGITFDRKRDLSRLNAQAARVYAVMQSGEWLGLQEIHDIILSTTGHDDPLQSISARTRDFKKEEFGGFQVDKRFVHRGLWQYRLIA